MIKRPGKGFVLGHQVVHLPLKSADVMCNEQRSAGLERFGLASCMSCALWALLLPFWRSPWGDQRR